MSNIKLSFRGVGDQNWSGFFTALCLTTLASGVVSGIPISTATSYHLFPGEDYQDRLWLTAITSGLRVVGTYYSTTNGSSFLPFGSNYTVASSGYDARMCVAPNGEMARAWLNQNSTISLQYFGRGDLDWTSPITVAVNGVALTPGYQGWGHLCYAYDYQQRLSLTIVPSGEVKAVDYCSFSDGASDFIRLN